MEAAAKSDFTQRNFIRRAALTWAGIAAIVLVINLVGIVSRRFPDPDDIMRLIQVRDLLAGQAWLDLHQYRVDAPNGGVLMHWSRLVDIPLVLVIAALTPVIGGANAEVAAITIVPLVTMGIAMALVARIVWKVLGDAPITMACVAMVLSVPLLFQLAPMRIDHHGWQIVGGLIAVNGVMSRSAVKGGLVAGLAMAAWLSISLEGLPLAAAVCAVLAWRWWRDNAQRLWLAFAMLGLGGGSVLFYLATKDASGLVTYCDAIGPAHIAMFLWGMAALGILAWINPQSRMALLAGFGLAGGGALAILIAWAPDCAGSNFAQLDPILISFWYEHVGEGLPIWRQTLSDIAQVTVFPLLGIWAAIRFARKGEEAHRAFWREYSFLLIASFCVAILVTRAGALSAALAAVPMGWQIQNWLAQISAMDKPLKRAGGMIALVLALAPALPIKAFDHFALQRVDPSKGAAQASALTSKTSTCELAQSAQLMADLPKGEVFAPLDIAPRLLLDTPHNVIATGHHRGEESMVFVIETALGGSHEARDALRARGTQYVAICPDLNEASLYAYAKPAGFAADLIAGKELDWLEPIAFETQSGLKAWRIKPE